MLALHTTLILNQGMTVFICELVVIISPHQYKLFSFVWSAKAMSNANVFQGGLVIVREFGTLLCMLNVRYETIPVAHNL